MSIDSMCAIKAYAKIEGSMQLDISDAACILYQADRDGSLSGATGPRPEAVLQYDIGAALSPENLSQWGFKDTNNLSRLLNGWLEKSACSVLELQHATTSLRCSIEFLERNAPAILTHLPFLYSTLPNPQDSQNELRINLLTQFQQSGETFADFQLRTQIGPETYFSASIMLLIEMQSQTRQITLPFETKRALEETLDTLSAICLNKLSLCSSYEQSDGTTQTLEHRVKKVFLNSAKKLRPDLEPLISRLLGVIDHDRITTHTSVLIDLMSYKASPGVTRALTSFLGALEGDSKSEVTQNDREEFAASMGIDFRSVDSSMVRKMREIATLKAQQPFLRDPLGSTLKVCDSRSIISVVFHEGSGLGAHPQPQQEAYLDFQVELLAQLASRGFRTWFLSRPLFSGDFTRCVSLEKRLEQLGNGTSGRNICSRLIEVFLDREQPEERFSRFLVRKKGALARLPLPEFKEQEHQFCERIDLLKGIVTSERVKFKICLGDPNAHHPDDEKILLLGARTPIGPNAYNLDLDMSSSAGISKFARISTNFASLLQEMYQSGMIPLPQRIVGLSFDVGNVRNSLRTQIVPGIRTADDTVGRDYDLETIATINSLIVVTHQPDDDDRDSIIDVNNNGPLTVFPSGTPQSPERAPNASIPQLSH